MPMLIKIRLHRRIILRALITKRKTLDPVLDATVVVNLPVARVPPGRPDPRQQLAEVLTLHNLAVAEPVSQLEGRHRRVVGLAHDVLPQRVDAVHQVAVRDALPLRAALLEVGERAVEQFLLCVSLCPRLAVPLKVWLLTRQCSWWNILIK